MKSVTTFVKDHDMFGHVINLNFDRQGDSHKTLCGGFFSMALKGFLIFYVCLMLNKLFSMGNDTNSTTEGLLHLEEVGTIDYAVMNMMIFHVLRKQDFKATPYLNRLDNITRYFTVNYVQNINNYTSQEFVSIKYPVKQCDQADFGTSNVSKALFDSWSGYTLVCADLQEGQKLEFLGDPSSIYSMHVGVVFEKCQQDCADDMEAWLQDVQVDTWTLQEKIDFGDYENRPTNLIQQRLNSNIFAETLNGKTIPLQHMDIVKNEFETEDDFFQIGQLTREGHFFTIDNSLQRAKF